MSVLVDAKMSSLFTIFEQNSQQDAFCDAPSLSLQLRQPHCPWGPNKESNNPWSPMNTNGREEPSLKSLAGATVPTPPTPGDGDENYSQLPWSEFQFEPILEDSPFSSSSNDSSVLESKEEDEGEESYFLHKPTTPRQSTGTIPRPVLKSVNEVSQSTVIGLHEIDTRTAITPHPIKGCAGVDKDRSLDTVRAVERVWSTNSRTVKVVPLETPKGAFAGFSSWPLNSPDQEHENSIVEDFSSPPSSLRSHGSPNQSQKSKRNSPVGCGVLATNSVSSTPLSSPSRTTTKLRQSSKPSSNLQRPSVEMNALAAEFHSQLHVNNADDVRINYGLQGYEPSSGVPTPIITQNIHGGSYEHSTNLASSPYPGFPSMSIPSPSSDISGSPPTPNSDTYFYAPMQASAQPVSVYAPNSASNSPPLSSPIAGTTPYHRPSVSSDFGAGIPPTPAGTGPVSSPLVHDTADNPVLPDSQVLHKSLSQVQQADSQGSQGSLNAEAAAYVPNQRDFQDQAPRQNHSRRGFSEFRPGRIHTPKRRNPPTLATFENPSLLPASPYRPTHPHQHVSLKPQSSPVSSTGNANGGRHNGHGSQNGRNICKEFSSQGPQWQNFDCHSDRVMSQLAAQAKRAELVESPSTKVRFKDFYRKVREKEKISFETAYKYGQEGFQFLPPQLHWRVGLELADLAKRQNRIKESRKWYRKVNKLQPFAAQGWLEHAKVEEECGELLKCQKIIANGLHFCPFNESLLVKGIKLEERMGNLTAARNLLSRLKNVSVDKVWKTILEGGLMEARAGNIKVARRVFKYLMKHVPWYGPVYHEAYRFEEKREGYEQAMEIIEKGLIEIPRYGPLWFGALRLYEKTGNGNLLKARATIKRATKVISKELVWKVYFEAAQVEERAASYDLGRAAYVQSIFHCPKNLRWKVWLGGARMELRSNRIDVARELLHRSMQEVPQKMRAMVLLECSRLEEFAGHVDRARQILRRARKETKYEWKVFLESVLLEIRDVNIKGAIAAAEEALKIHSGTGRLWAVLIQLKDSEGEEEQLRVFREALQEVPKSGEVWCEGARISLNPCSSYFNLKSAKKFLSFAIKFTPQYGDSFIENLRLEMLLNGPSADATKLTQLCINADPNYGAMWFHCKEHPLNNAAEVLRKARSVIREELETHHTVYQRAILSNWYSGPTENPSPPHKDTDTHPPPSRDEPCDISSSQSSEHARMNTSSTQSNSQMSGGIPRTSTADSDTKFPTSNSTRTSVPTPPTSALTSTAASASTVQISALTSAPTCVPTSIPISSSQKVSPTSTLTPSPNSSINSSLPSSPSSSLNSSPSSSPSSSSSLPTPSSTSAPSRSFDEKESHSIRSESTFSHKFPSNSTRDRGLVEQWKITNFNSLSRLYPPTVSLDPDPRYCLLFGSSMYFID